MTAIEFPLIVRREIQPTPSFSLEKKQFVKMTGGSKKSDMMSDPFTDFFNEKPFLMDGEEESRPLKKQKSMGSKKNGATSIINVNQMAQAQISSVLLADEILIEKR